MEKDLLEVIMKHLKRHDWYYNYSDDSFVYKAGSMHWDFIVFLFQRAKEKRLLEEVRGILRQIAPKEFDPPKV